MAILLAPMEGLLDCVLRDVLTRVGGVDLCVSESIRVPVSAKIRLGFDDEQPAEDCAQLLRAERMKWAQVVKAANIRMD